MAGLQLIEEQHIPAARPADNPAWLYQFRREPGTVKPSTQASAALRGTCLVEGDMVTLSTEGVPLDPPCYLLSCNVT